MPLSPEQRSLRARIAAHSKWAKYDPARPPKRCAPLAPAN